MMASPVLGAEQLARLRDQFQEYSQGSHYRTNGLAIRRRAHPLVRNLTSPESIPSLSLDSFDEHVWNLGIMGTRSESFTWHRADQVFAETAPDRFSAMLDSGELWFSGNVTWGSAAKTLRAFTQRRSRPPTNEQLEIQMRQALMLLLHSQDPIRQRLRQVRDMRIGFGRNVSSGLLMTWYPQEYILFNKRSDQCWAAFGKDFGPGYDWVEPYLRYNAFCRELLEDPILGLEDLVDLDVFVYWHTVAYPAPSVEKKAGTGQKRGRKPKATRSGIILEQLKATKREMSPDKFRATWGDLYDKLAAEELSKLTTDVTAEELGQRAKRRVDEIQAFLHGQTATTPSAEVLCDWIQLCYALDLYREASALFPFVREDEVSSATYNRVKKVADVSRRKRMD